MIIIKKRFCHCIAFTRFQHTKLYSFKKNIYFISGMFFQQVVRQYRSQSLLSIRETLKFIQMANATDGILSLTAVNAVVPCRSIQWFTITGLESQLIITVIISSKVIVKTSHEAQSALNSGQASALVKHWVTLTQDLFQCPGS